MNYRRRAFVEEYIKCWVGTQAAKNAGYSERSASSTASYLLTIPEIQDRIIARIAELKMTPDEIFVRLSEHARGAYADYIKPDGSVDLAQLLADGKGHLIKAIKWTESGFMNIEFYDSQVALINLGKIFKMFSDRSEISIKTKQVEDMSDDELIAIASSAGAAST